MCPSVCQIYARISIAFETHGYLGIWVKRFQTIINGYMCLAAVIRTCQCNENAPFNFNNWWTEYLSIPTRMRTTVLASKVWKHLWTIPVPCGSNTDVLMSWKSSRQFLIIYKCHIVVYGLPCVPRYFSQTFVAIYERIPGPYGSHTDVLIVMKMRPSVCQIYAWISIEFRIPCVPGYLGKTFSNNYERIHVPCGRHTDFSMWWKCAFQF